MKRFLLNKNKVNIQPAYTIIELVIAASIIVLVTSIALPKYQVFSDRQEFIKRVNNLNDCIQKAQQLAVDEGNMGRDTTLVEANINFGQDNTGTTNSVICSIKTHNNAEALEGKLSGADYIYPTGNSYDNANLCDSDGKSCTINDMNLISVQRSDIRSDSHQPNVLLPYSNLSNIKDIPLRIFFGAKQRGIPIAIYKSNASGVLDNALDAKLNNRTSYSIDSFKEQNQWGYDSGIDINLVFQDTAGNYHASIRISPLGSPINLEIN